MPNARGGEDSAHDAGLKYDSISEIGLTQILAVEENVEEHNCPGVCLPCLL